MTIVQHNTVLRQNLEQKRSPLLSNKFPEGFKKLLIAHSDRQLTDFLNIAEANGFSNESALNLLYGLSTLKFSDSYESSLKRINEYLSQLGIEI